jgi:hypothetical protein
VVLLRALLLWRDVLLLLLLLLLLLVLLLLLLWCWLQHSRWQQWKRSCCMRPRGTVRHCMLLCCL